MTSTHLTLFGLPTHPFWEFSLSVYSHPDVKEACLALQNHQGMNVNIILFCCWFGTTGRGHLTKEEIQLALTTIHKWHQGITQGFRQLRYNLANYTATKLPLKKMRQSILDYELAAEQIEQLMLAGAINKPPRDHQPNLKKLQDAIESLKNYAHLIVANLKEDDCAMLCQLLTQVFIDMPKNEILQQCRLFSL